MHAGLNEGDGCPPEKRTNMSLKEKSIWLGTCGSWWLCHTARAFEQRNVLAGLWISDKNATRLASALYHRCWPYHLAMKLFYHWARKSGWRNFFIFLSLVAPLAAISKMA